MVDSRPVAAGVRLGKPGAFCHSRAIHRRLRGLVQQIASVQILRALAALLVAYGHAVHEAGRVAGLKGGQFSAPGQFLSGVGVDLFFAISGFVMVLSSLRLYGAGDGRWQFLKRRLARIVPIYWLVTAIFLLGQALTGVAARDIVFSAGEILQSLLFIPFERADLKLIQPVYSLGWTLNYEMFFYLLFALLMAATAAATVGRVALILIAVVIAGLVLNPTAPPLRFWSHPIVLEFVLGMGIGLLFLKGVRLSPVLGAGLALAGAMAFPVLNRDGFLPTDGWRLLMAGVPMALVLAGCALGFPGAGPPRRGPLVQLGDASYALYLFHPMAIRALGLVALGKGLIGGWGLVIAALLASAVVSVVIYRLFERPLTRWLQGGR
jgi:peptidoglycan/LPS O-acetylase OafA/YrhL